MVQFNECLYPIELNLKAQRTYNLDSTSIRLEVRFLNNNGPAPGRLAFVPVSLDLAAFLEEFVQNLVTLSRIFKVCAKPYTHETYEIK